MALNRVLLFIVIVCMISCDTKESAVSYTHDSSAELVNKSEVMSLGDFVSWVGDSDNKLVKNKELNEVNYILAFMPAEALAHIELKDEPYSGQQFDQALKNYSGMSYFNLRIERPKDSGEILKLDLQNSAQYTDRLNYMAFAMQHDLTLVQGKDTLHPGLYHFERIFELSSYVTVMLAFDNSKFQKDKEFTIIYNDRLFNKGYIKYTYFQNQLIDLPIISGV
ncbi:MAG TPA: hypothetical protein VF868_13710 [Bacteroidia bacterium]|jgi:hypothetical protein